MVLNEKHFKVIKSYSKPHRTYVASEEFKTGEQEILEKIKTFQSLSPKKIKSLDEFSLGELFSKIWVFNFWGNKDCYIHQILSANDLENIKKALVDLFYGRGFIEERHDHFLKRVKWSVLGSTTAELLKGIQIHIDPSVKVELIIALLKETTSVGVGVFYPERIEGQPKVDGIKTEYRKAKVKMVGYNSHIIPKYESCRELAEKTGKPLKVIYNVIHEKAKNLGF